jgi:hypothetical protein
MPFNRYHMKPFLFTLISMAVITGYTTAQDIYPLKRKPYKLAVAVDKKTNYEEDLTETNYVLSDQTVQLYPGESVFIEIEQADGVVKNVRAVAENKHPEKTLVISFNQQVKKKVHESMMLKIHNPFPIALKYTTKIYLMHYKKWVNTNVLPVGAGLSGFEMWPDVISSIAISDWAFGNK